MVKSAKDSETVVVNVSSVQGIVEGSKTYIIKTIDYKHKEEMGMVYGVPLKELEAFGFVIPFSNEYYHLTPKAFERVSYQEAGSMRKFLIRTTPIQWLIVVTVGFVTVLMAILGTMLNLLLNLRQLLQP
jgi:hypothetical protein